MIYYWLHYVSSFSSTKLEFRGVDARLETSKQKSNTQDTLNGKHSLVTRLMGIFGTTLSYRIVGEKRNNKSALVSKGNWGLWLCVVPKV